MKKFIIFLLPILFLFSCTKPYGDEPYLDGPSPEDMFKGKWECKYEAKNASVSGIGEYTTTFTINIEGNEATYDYNIKGKSGEVTNESGSGSISDVSFEKGVNFNEYNFTYEFEGNKYTHTTTYITHPSKKIDWTITLDANNYGIFAFKLHSTKRNEEQMDTKDSIKFVKK